MQGEFLLCRVLLTTVPALLACACSPQVPQALGTLEYDRITLPAPVSERIVSVEVVEGQQIAAGTVLMTLETTRARAQAAGAAAEAERQRGAQAELVHGARSETITQARANLNAARAEARNAQSDFERLQALGQQSLVSARDVDRARTTAESTRERERVANAALDELVHGTRREQIAQVGAAARAAEAQVAVQQDALGRLRIVTPRAGRVDSLPYKLGDQPPAGAPLAIVLTGAAPYARIYVPETVRANMKIDDAVIVHVEGHAPTYAGHIRAIRSEPSFTPYYALTGKDAARLSYLTEVTLGPDANDLPAGLPVQAEFPQP